MPHSKPNSSTSFGLRTKGLSDIPLMTSFRFLFAVQWTSFHESSRFISDKMRKVSLFSPFFKKIAKSRLVLPQMSAEESWPNFEIKLDWNRILFRFRSGHVSTVVKSSFTSLKYGRFSRNRSAFIYISQTPWTRQSWIKIQVFYSWLQPIFLFKVEWPCQWAMLRFLPATCIEWHL